MKPLFWLMALIPLAVGAQQNLTGTILDGSASQEQGLPGANVVWLGSSTGAVTDLDGQFEIPYLPEYQSLVISYVGYRSDTLEVRSNSPIRFSLYRDDTLGEVTVSARKKASSRSFLEAQNTILVSSAELLKAACCNLAESFETNPSIDVNFADAITGARQIKMLGLTSPNILITTENIPAIRGASQTYGLSFIPGPWVESIQITKGTGSVVNGYESIAGQINAELQKPSLDDRLFVNAYGAINGRLELNTHLNTKVSDKWDTGLYVHADTRGEKFDRNDDGFLDLPLAQQINLMNRWQYTDAENGLVSFINVRYMNDEKQSGQVDFDPTLHKGGTQFWGSEVDTQRIDASAKLGWVNPEIPYQSLGVQTAFSYHDQESYFGLQTYDIQHTSFYGNLIYNSIISDSRHKVKTGVSFTYDGYDEVVNGGEFDRKENSIGGFFEYQYDDLGDLNMTAGIRVDNHNRMGFFVTPRLHVRYTPWERSAFRFSVGSGQRTANIFTENQQLFSSNRSIQILDTDGPVYGLDPEKAWNFGLSYLQGFDLFGKKADVTLDFYRTDYTNQVVVDWFDPRTVRFYNLDGKSFANSFQAEFNYNPFDRFDLRLAYKYFDVQSTYRDLGESEIPLVPKNRFFANASWETKVSPKGGQWKVDVTFNWLDTQLLPSTDSNPPQYQLGDRSPTVGTLNAQVTKVFSPNFEVYLGGENITDVRQEQPVLGADDPFGSFFDSTIVYGPIFGSSYYMGLRYKLN